MNARLVALLLAGSVVAASIGPGVDARPATVRGVYFLKLRAAPGFTAKERGVLSEGDVVEIEEEVGRWAKVRLQNGSTGYVSRKYLHSPDPAGTPSSDEAGQDQPRTPAADGARNVVPTAEQDPPAPPSSRRTRPDHAPVTTARVVTVPERRPRVCTESDLAPIREELEALASGQDRLAALVEAPASEAEREQSIWSLSTKQMVFWLGLGCLVGWAAASLGRRRGRRIFRT
jgi:hypothetical protein